MTRLWLVRHGEAHVNQFRDDGLVHVIDEHGLTDRGIKQAERLRDRLTKDADIQPDVIIASTYPRASQTAAIASANLGLAVVEDSEVQEWRLGADAIGVTLDEALASWQRVRAGSGHDDRISPQTETHNEFIARVDSALLRIAANYSGKEVLVFTHGGVVNRSFATFMDLPQTAPLVSVQPRHTSLTEWTLVEEFGSPIWVLARYNDTTHLK
jgi:probable phosphoglycerate mutase